MPTNKRRKSAQDPQKRNSFKKLKQITWDRMSIHLKAINGLKNNYILFNYQIRKIGKEERRMIQIIFDLRRAQRELKRDSLNSTMTTIATRML